MRRAGRMWLQRPCMQRTQAMAHLLAVDGGPVGACWADKLAGGKEARGDVEVLRPLGSVTRIVRGKQGAAGRSSRSAAHEASNRSEEGGSALKPRHATGALAARHLPKKEVRVLWA